MSESKHTPGHTDIVFDGFPGPEGPRFVEVEDASMHSRALGEWVERDDGYAVLRLPASPEVIAAAPDLLEALEEIRDTAHIAADHGVVTKDIMQAIARQANAALAKARGEQPEEDRT